MNHKRGRPKSRRSGCLMCKYYKHQRHGKDRVDSARMSNVRRREVAGEKLKEML